MFAFLSFSCFLHGIAFYVGVFAPASFVLLINFVMFVLTMYSLSQMGKKVSEENKMSGYHRVSLEIFSSDVIGRLHRSNQALISNGVPRARDMVVIKTQKLDEA